MKRTACCVVILLSLITAHSLAQNKAAWPYPFPCRVQDGNNPDLFVMTLGDVQTSLAQGRFDPTGDRVTMNDGTVKERYYQEVLGLKYYKPIDKTHFPLPPSGWCTWYYYYPRITSTEVKRNAKWISENLKEYGARYVQIDDGWQVPRRDWTQVKQDRFPDGMADVASYVKSVGLTPGIWIAPHGQSNDELVRQNPNVFLLKPDGTTASDTWEGKYLVDPTTPEAHAYLKDLFRKLCDWGYEYFKIDGQPIVVEEYKTKKSFMKHPADDTDGLYRKTLDSIREVIGPDRYLLGCWGIPVEGVNIMDGSRTGGDIVLGWGGFQTALRAVMGYYYQHNVAWYVDPDVMVLRSPLTVEQARVWATLQGLTGQALMATDRMMDLGEERVEMLRRVYPAVDIRPFDLYPSERNKRIWDLKVNHLGRSYDVVGLFNFDEAASDQMLLRWADLGLPADRPVHVFDFWNQEYLGAWQAGIAVDVAPTSCRVLTLIPANGQIQLISTNRHITQGWVDLVDLQYEESSMTYRGKSRVVKGDPYELRFSFPRDKNFEVTAVKAQGESGRLAATVTNHQGWATVRITSDTTCEVAWEVQFRPSDMYRYPSAEPSNLSVERIGLDGVNVTWNEQYYLNVGYQAYLNGELQGYTPRASFPLRGLDPAASYKVAVETVWEDGTASPKKPELSFSLASMAPKRMSLSQLNPIYSAPPGGPAGPRRGFARRPLMIGDRSYDNALIVRPGAEVAFQIDGAYNLFSAEVGIGNDTGVDQAFEFVLLGDGQELWRSGSLKQADGVRPVKIEIAGVKRLVLRVIGEVPERRVRIQTAWLDGVLSR